MKKILVSGGAGFLGSHLISRLVDEYEVYCLDNYFTGNVANINQFKSKSNFHIIEHDIINFFDKKFDFIYNLASPASPKYYQLNPIETIKTNILGSINLLELAKKHNSTPAQVALNWLINFHQNVFAIPGATSKKQCEDNIGALDINLSFDELEKLDYISKK